MKIILTAMCVCIVLFGGGCAVLLAGSGVNLLILLPLAIVALNLAVLAALYGWAEVPAWPLYVLAAIDCALALGVGVGVIYSLADLGSSAFLGIIPVVVAGLKGYLTIQVARKRPRAG